jgi:peptidoglycan/LPS O-acetylase OafA/YrhL
MENKKFKEIELLRGFAIIGVIIMHFTALSQRFIHSLFTYSVPLFVFISGFILSFKYNDDYSLGDFYKKRFKNIIPPYVIFSFLYIFTSIFVFNTLEASSISIDFIFFKILTATSSFHLWFIALIFQFYLLYPLIERLIKKFENHLSIILLISIILQITWTFLRVSCREYLNIFQENYITSFLNHAISNSFLGYIAFFFLGISFLKNYERIKRAIELKKVVFFLVISVIFLEILYFSLETIWASEVNNNYFFISYLNKSILYFIGLFLYSVIIILLLKLSLILGKYKNIAIKVLYKFGQHSFGIFLIHILIRSIVDLFLKCVGVRMIDWYYYPIAIIIVSLGSLFVVYLISFIPHHEYLIGKVR